MNNYKIIKEISPRSGQELYTVYRRTFFNLFWKYIGVEFSVEDCKRLILLDKQKLEWKQKSKKKEIIGYYE